MASFFPTAQQAAAAVWAAGIAGSAVAAIPSTLSWFGYGKLASAASKSWSVPKGFAFTSFYVFGLVVALAVTWLLVSSAQRSRNGEGSVFLGLSLGLDEFSSTAPLAVLFLYSLHLCRRVFECFFVHKHGAHARMAIHLWLAGLAHYLFVPFTLVPMTALYWLSSSSPSPPSPPSSAGDSASVPAGLLKSSRSTDSGSCSSGSGGGGLLDGGSDWGSFGNDGGGFGGGASGSCTAPPSPSSSPPWPASASALLDSLASLFSPSASTQAAIESFVSSEGGPMVAVAARSSGRFPFIEALHRLGFRASFWVFEHRFLLAAIGLALFVAGNLLQHAAHRQLARLKNKEAGTAAGTGPATATETQTKAKTRSKGQAVVAAKEEKAVGSKARARAREYPIPPAAGAFRLCLAPHYLGEILIYLALALLMNADALVGAIGGVGSFAQFVAGLIIAAETGSFPPFPALATLFVQFLRPLAPLLLTSWVFANLSATALANRRYYFKQEEEKEGKKEKEEEASLAKGRAALIPFLL